MNLTPLVLLFRDLECRLRRGEESVVAMVRDVRTWEHQNPKILAHEAEIEARLVKAQEKRNAEHSVKTAVIKGHYRATSRPIKTTPSFGQGKCHHCDSIYNMAHTTQKFCCGACRQANYRKERKKRGRPSEGKSRPKIGEVSRACLICSTEFVRESPQSPYKYCSDQCAAAARHNREKARLGTRVRNRSKVQEVMPL